MVIDDNAAVTDSRRTSRGCAIPANCAAARTTAAQKKKTPDQYIGRYLFVGAVADTHPAGDHFVQADGHGHHKVLGLDDVHPADERHVVHESPGVEH